MSTPNLGSVTFDHWTTQTIGKITPLYVRGTGFHQGGSRMVQVGSTSLIPSNQVTTKGLGFLKLDRTTHEPVALSPGVISVVKNTHTHVSESNALAVLIDSVTENEIGILTSCDKFEGNPSAALRDAAERVGLLRLAAFVRGKLNGTDASSQRAYAAVFSGAGSETRVHQALEAFESNHANAPAAVLSTFLIDGGIGTQSPSNELVPSDPNAHAVGVVVNKSGHVGIGTRSPGRTLDVDGDANVRGTLFGNVVGRASSAQTWSTPRTLTLEGDVVGSIAWDGSSDVSMSTSFVGVSDGTIDVTAGGTGRSALDAGKLLVGSGTNAVSTPSSLHWNEQEERLGIGTSSPETAMHVNGTVTANTFRGSLDKTLTFVDGTNTVIATFENTSDVTVPITGGSGSAGGIVASLDNVGAPKYTGFTPTEGAFYGGNVDPTGDVRLNYDGDFYASNLVGSTTGIDATMETLTCRTATVGERITSHTLRCNRFLGNEGTFEGSVSATGFETVSDARWKQQIEPIRDATSILEAWNGVRFSWSDAREPGTQIGLLAQEVASTCPEGVVVGDDGYLRVRYGNLIAVLVEALKSQTRRIDELERKIAKA